MLCIIAEYQLIFMHLKDVTDVLIGKRPRDSTILKPANGAYEGRFSVQTMDGSCAGVRSMRTCEARRLDAVVQVVCAVYDRTDRESRVRAAAFGMPGRAPARACGRAGRMGRAGCGSRVRPRKSYGSCAVMRRRP